MHVSLVTTWSIENVSTYLASLRSLVIFTVYLSLHLFLPVISLVEFVEKPSKSITGSTFAPGVVNMLSTPSVQLKKDVWDGKDLEGVPEEPEEDVEPFVKIDEETIQHFSHEHYLKLHNNNRLYDADKVCEACSLPIIPSKAFYSCMQCNFVLDEACACLPRKIHHPQRIHPLTFNLLPGHNLWGVFVVKGMLKCNACEQLSCGFVYECMEYNCNFQLDVRCAPLPDPLIHDSHPHDDHLLFFNSSRGKCTECQDYCSRHYIECMKCKFFLGVRCASLPSVAYYKHDKHPLTLCYGEEGSENLHYWCEICESKLDASRWFCTCDSCRVTIHLTCFLGKDMYMKPKKDDDNLEIRRNNGSTRPFCSACD